MLGRFDIAICSLAVFKKGETRIFTLSAFEHLHDCPEKLSAFIFAFVGITFETRKH